MTQHMEHVTSVRPGQLGEGFSVSRFPLVEHLQQPFLKRNNVTGCTLAGLDTRLVVRIDSQQLSVKSNRSFKERDKGT